MTKTFKQIREQDYSWQTSMRQKHRGGSKGAPGLLNYGTMKRHSRDSTSGSLTDKQIQNLKKIWNDSSKVFTKDAEQFVKNMVKKLDNDSRYRLAKAGIKHISKLAESKIDNVKKAVEIAKSMAGNMTGAEKEIEKIQKGLSKHIRVADALRLANEEAPANATGTAVAGTGDDSSTVLVKRRKELQKRLLRRFAIKETLDKILPDPVEKEDEITTRKKQLKELAKNRKLSEARYEVTIGYDAPGNRYYDLTVIVDASNEADAKEKGINKVEKLRNSPTARKIGIDDPTGDIDVTRTNKSLNYTDITKDTSP